MFSVCQVLHWHCGRGTGSSLQELQFNNGTVAAAEFVDLPEFNPLIKTEPLEGWLPGAGGKEE